MNRKPSSRGWQKALVLATLGWCAALAPVSAQFTCTTNSGTITITGYTGAGGAVSIPSNLNGLVVSSIGTYAFYGNNNITSLTVPSSVTSLADSAFYYMSGMSSISLTNGLTSIGRYAFYHCSALTSLTIPATVTSIGPYALRECSRLTNITVAAQNAAYSSVGGVLFSKNQTSLLVYPNGRAGSYAVPSGVTYIDYQAFYACTNLTGVTFPSTLTTIGDNAFIGCHGLTSLSIPRYVSSIGDLAFQQCNRLTDINVDEENNAYSSSSGVLFNRNRTKLIQFPGGKSGSYTVPSGVTNIATQAFGWSSNLTSVTLSSTVTSLGNNVFWYSPNLASISFPAGLTNLGTAAVWFCPSLTNLTMDPGNAVFSSVGGVLFNKSQTQLIQYPSGRVGDYVVPNGVTNIGMQAFYECSRVTGVIMPASVASVDNSAFWNCTNVTNFSFSSGLTNIVRCSFWGCSKLTSLVFPASLTAIGDNAFNSCRNLTNVCFQGNAPGGAADSSIFSGDNSANVYYLANATGWGATFGGRPAALWRQVVTGVATPSSGGTVTGGGAYPVGTNVQLVATASNGWLFTSWNTGASNTPLIVTVPMTNVTYAANFAAQFTFITNAGQITITGYIGAGGAVSVPGSINRLPVNALGARAFAGCSSIASLTLPGSLTTIGHGAFSNCVGLTTLAIPDSVTSLGSNFCHSCSSLTSVTLPATLTSLAYGAFCGCSSLRNISLPVTLTNIGAYAFQSCGSLAAITLPAGLTSVGAYAFSSCPNLVTVYFLGNGLALGSDIFSGSIQVTVYYMLGTTGWTGTCGGRPTALWQSTVSATPNPAQGGAVAGAGSYPAGTNVQLTATASNGWVFASWNTGATNNPLSVAVAATNTSYTANFTLPFTFTTNSGTITITGYSGNSGTVVIPGSINGLPVTSIGAFAFMNCLSMTNVTLSTNLTSLADYAFSYARNLATITIPRTLTSIGGNVFDWCMNLTAINVDALNPNYSSLDGVLFNKTQTQLIRYPGNKGGNYTIPGTVTDVAYLAFYHCMNLTGVTIPSSVVRMESSVFYNCYGLTSVTLPSGITRLGSYLFYSCYGLTTVNLPAGILDIGSYAFAECRALTGVYLRGNAPTVGASVFDNANYATNYYVNGTTGWGSTLGGKPAVLWPSSVSASPSPAQGGAVAGAGSYPAGTSAQLTATASNGWLFAGWNTGATNNPLNVTVATSNTSYTANFTLPFMFTTNGGAITITGYTGAGGAVVLPDSVNGLPVTGLGGFAFTNHPNVTSLTLPVGLTTLADRAFSGCTGLTVIALSSNITSLGVNVFEGCSALTAINVDAQNPAYCSAGGVLFNKSQTQLIRYPQNKGGTYAIPDTVTELGDYAFDHCLNLTGLTLPASVTRLGVSAFDHCTGLTTLTLPAGVDSIGASAFATCPNLTSVYFQGNGLNLGDDAFAGSTQATVYRMLGTSNWGATCGGRPTALWQSTVSVSPNPAQGGAAGGAGTFPAGSNVWLTATVSNGWVFAGWSTGATNNPLSLTVATTNSSFTANFSLPFTYITNNGAITITGYTGDNLAVLLPDSINGLPVNTLGGFAFTNRPGVTNLTFAATLTTLADHALAGCSGLVTCVLPRTVTNIGSHVFDGCTGLTAIIVDAQNPAYSSTNGVLFNKNQTVLLRHPENKSGAYTIPGTVTDVGDYAFQHCTKLTDITIPANVARLGEGAFYGCSGLTGVTLPEGVSHLGNYLFYGCQNLATVNLPIGVTDFGDYAFSECDGLTAVYTRGNAPTAGAGVFDHSTHVTNYYVNGHSGWDGSFCGRPIALWHPMATLTLEIRPEGVGSFSGAGDYAEGTVVPLSATPDHGWAFTNWSNGATNNPYNFTMPATNCTLTANFIVAPNQSALTLTKRAVPVTTYANMWTVPISKGEQFVGGDYWLRLEYGQPSFDIWSVGSLASRTTIDEKWHQVSGRYTRGANAWGPHTLEILVDGAVVSKTVTSGTPTPSTASLMLGAYLGNSFFYRGLMDEVRLSHVLRSDAWLQTTYAQQQYSSAFLAFGPEEASAVPGYAHRKLITINGALVAGPLTNFPVLVNTIQDALRTGVVSSNAADIRFTSDSGVALAHEVELFRQAAGKLVAWVRLPLLAAGINTQFYINYGSAAPGAPAYAPSAVWDAGFSMVQHFKDASGRVLDSTANNNTGVVHGATASAYGSVAGAFEFNGTNQYIEVANSTSVQLNTADFTIEGWFCRKSLNADALFEIAVTNAGPDTALNLAIGDALPGANFSLVRPEAAQGLYDAATGRWQVGDLPVGAAATLQLAVNCNANGSLTNTASVAACDSIDTNQTSGTHVAGYGQQPFAVVTASGANGKPDFVLSSLFLTPAAPRSGGSFTATVAVVNQGSVAGPAGKLRLWLNKPATALASEPGDATVTLGTLAAGASTNVSFALSAAAVMGSYTMRAFVDADAAVTEQNEDNNQRTLDYTLGGGGSDFGSPTAVAAALDATNLAWSLGGDAPWYSQSGTKYGTASAAQTPVLGSGQNSLLQVVTNGPASLQFWWKTSTAATNTLQFFVNGQLVTQVAGSADWSPYALYLGSTNQYTLTWLYSKRSGAVTGSDAAWLDQVTWLPNTCYANRPQLFYQAPDGTLAGWVLATNGSVLASRLLGAASTWQLTCAGDLDGDGVSDLLFETAAGDIKSCYLDTDGTTRSTGTWPNIGAWRLRACCDYLGMGRGQLFFQSGSGNIAYWTISSNGTITAATSLGDMHGWTLRGAADLDGDHKADLLWQNDAGVLAVWSHNPDGSIRSSVICGCGNWVLGGVTDVDGDGIGDFLWQHTDGNTAVWYMQSNTTIRAATYWWNTGAWKLRAVGR